MSNEALWWRFSFNLSTFELEHNTQRKDSSMFSPFSFLFWTKTLQNVISAKHCLILVSTFDHLLSWGFA
jgi:hypothetical protein